MPGIGVITNPRSRANKRDPASMRRLGYLIGSRGAAAATHSLDDLYRVAEEFKKEEIEFLGINGGDGTIHHTLTAFIKVYGQKPLPQVAILRGGTMNTIANSLGIKGDPAKLLFELVDRYHNHDPMDVFEKEILAVGDAYGFIFGNGVVFNFLDAYYSSGRPSPTAGLKLLLRGVLSALVGGKLARQLTGRFRGQVTVDGDRWACEDFMTVAASCVEQIGLGFKPFYRCEERPHHFAILGIHTHSTIGLVAELPRVLRGKPMRRDKVIDQVAREVLFESDGEVKYTVDGDTYTTQGSLRLRTGPRLSFVRLSGQAGE
ncbi:MAG: diacylglycerol kinase [Myxococcales bacterium]|nr:diacylglycerol kinase [Myxococcales bacterium]